MYAISTVRSGSTAFCINKAYEQGIEYGGELNPVFINPFIPSSNHLFLNFKQQFHETGIQPTYTPEMYVDVIENIKSPSVLYLVPVRLNATLLPGADFYITRKNIKNIFVSLCNLNIKSRVESYGYVEPNTVDTSGFLNFMLQISLVELRALIAMLTYCKKYSKEITWYEDIFSRDTEYTYFKAWSQAYEFEDKIHQMLLNINFSDLNSNIIVDAV